MTPKKSYEIINRILWVLKVPEVGFTFLTAISFILAVFGLLSFNVPIAAFCTRLVLVPVRILIVSKKRKLEKIYPAMLNLHKFDAVKETKRVISGLGDIQMKNTIWVQGVINRVFNFIFK